MSHVHGGANFGALPVSRFSHLFRDHIHIAAAAEYVDFKTTGRAVTDVDFASQVNLGSHYPHVKTDTLVLRLVLDSNRLEYTYHRCSDLRQQYNYQWLPDTNSPSDILPGFNIHALDEHYELRLLGVPYSIRGYSLGKS